jgi:hypothetical protein
VVVDVPIDSAEHGRETVGYQRFFHPRELAVLHQTGAV